MGRRPGVRVAQQPVAFDHHHHDGEDAGSMTGQVRAAGAQCGSPVAGNRGLLTDEIATGGLSQTRPGAEVTQRRK